MQIILNESECEKMKNNEAELKRIKNILRDSLNITFNDDGNMIRGIRPTVKDISINKDNIIDLILAERIDKTELKRKDIKFI